MQTSINRLTISPYISLLLSIGALTVIFHLIFATSAAGDGPGNEGGKRLRTGSDRAYESSGKRLRFPSIEDTVRTLRQDIVAFAPTDSALLSLPERSRKLLRGVYNYTGKDRSERFGSLESGQYLPIVETTGDRTWRGLLQEEDKVLLLSGEESKIYYGRQSVTKRQNMKQRPDGDRSLILEHVKSINLKAVRPAADNRGEPSALETDRTRKALSYRFLKDGPIRFTGIAPWPTNWSKDIIGRSQGSEKLYALAGAMQGFELSILQCPAAEQNPLSAKTSRPSPSEPCDVVRQCFIEGASKDLYKGISGVAISPKRRLIILGDSLNHRLLFVRYDSCFHMPVIRTVALPAELKLLTNVAIDVEDNLWVATAKADDYYNASLFRWSNW